MPENKPLRRRQDLSGRQRPLYERIILLVLGSAAFAGAVAGAWWLWSQSGVSSIVRDGAPDWSPDGEIIFSSEVDGRSELILANRSGGNRRQLTHKGADEGHPTFSIDGLQIAFDSDREGNREIYSMAANGDAPRRLTNDPAIDQAPAWSRDGRQIVFMSNRSNKDFDLFRMNADGTGVQQLTHGGMNGFPQYSPDGGQLALHVGTDTYIMSLSTLGLRRLTYEPNNGMHPAWSPDGLRVAFMSWRNGRSEIFTARPDGSEVHSVVTMPTGDAVDPRWSRDGKFIAFVHVPDADDTHVAKRTQQRIVFVVELSTGRISRVSR